jgi:uncharacterized caspase-like protein
LQFNWNAQEDAYAKLAESEAIRSNVRESLNETKRFSNSPAKPPALPERIEEVTQLREQSHEVIRSPWGNREALKEIAMSQDHNHLNHATWECKYHVVFTPKYRKKMLFG